MLLFENKNPLLFFEFDAQFENDIARTIRQQYSDFLKKFEKEDDWENYLDLFPYAGLADHVKKHEIYPYANGWVKDIKKFYSFETIVYKSANDKNKYLKLNEEDILRMRLDDIFAWSDDIGKKWQVAVDNKTPMYLFSESLKTKEPYIISFAIRLTKEKPKGK
uniref:Uncharacterized protein n=1 Tax=Meloidogyne javanica TaxID=6303 RepID=A0A915LS58_MELJA